MALVSHKQHEVEVVKVTTETIDQFTLTLNRAEAQFLMDLCGKVGGCPFSTRRKHSQAVYDALKYSNKLLPTHEYAPDLEGQSLYIDMTETEHNTQREKNI